MGDRKRMNVEGDRLSSLSDDLLHKILSSVSIKYVVQTSVLSSRWRFIWTLVSNLIFLCEDFKTLNNFSEFVTHVLSRRNNQVKVSSINLIFCKGGCLLNFQKILNCVISNNVEQLYIAIVEGEGNISPPYVFSSQSLKNLTLTRCDFTGTPPTWDLPALTTLNLHDLRLYGKFVNATGNFDVSFSNCTSLKNLTLKRCGFRGVNLNICHPGLTSLTLEDDSKGVNIVVTTPLLKNLTIKNWQGIHQISAPKLSFLHYKDNCNPLQLSTDLPHMERVDLCIFRPREDKEFSNKIVGLLQQLRSVKFLTLNLELVKLLSLSVELISRQSSPFTNLNSLKIYPAHVTLEEHTQPKVTMSLEVKNFLLNSSPGATFTMVSDKEIRAVNDVVSARKLMGELQVLLDQLKENSETHIESHLATVRVQEEVGNSNVVPDTEMKCQFEFEERMAQIESYWGQLNKELEKWSRNTDSTISMLQMIEGVLEKLPTSHREKLQARYSGLCAEAEAIMDGMMNRMKINCGKKPFRSDVFFHELGTWSQPVSS